VYLVGSARYSVTCELVAVTVGVSAADSGVTIVKAGEALVAALERAACSDDSKPQT
jgi:hypothetical protein